MTGKRIFSLVLILTIFSLLGILLLYFFSGLGKDIMLSVIGLAFMLISALIFIPAFSRSVVSSDLSRFLKVFMIKSFVKIAGVILIAVLYFRFVGVGSKIAVLPFLAVYLLYTSLETVYAYKIAQKKTREKSDTGQP